TFKSYIRESDNAKFLIETSKEKTVETYITNEAHARMIGNRWAFILSDSMGRFSFNTKLQGATVNVGAVVVIELVRLFSGMGVNSKRRLFLVESVRKNGFNVNIECVDLGNLFNKIACISDISSTYDTATDDEKLYAGFITDAYGMQDNDS